MSAFENVDFPAPAGPVTKTAYLIVGQSQDSRDETRVVISDPLRVKFPSKADGSGWQVPVRFM